MFRLFNYQLFEAILLCLNSISNFADIIGENLSSIWILYSLSAR